VRHASREAAAKCFSCGEFFCRECVVEHGGRLLCSPCLARSVSGPGAGVRKRAAARAAALVSGCLVLWLGFYVMGALLVRIPAEVHDGTVWRRITGE
jgi:hypothetical protein